MVNTRKLMSAALAAAMLLSASSCSLIGQDNKKEEDPDDIIDLAEDFAKSVVTADADKILKNFEDVDDDDAEKFKEDLSLDDQDEDNVYLKEYIASTMEYEVDEDSVEIKNDKASCDVYFTIVDYMDSTGDLAGEVNEFYDVLLACGSTIKYTVALDFVYEDGEWILLPECFDDLDKLFTYVNYEFDFVYFVPPQAIDACWYNSDGDYVNTSYIELDVYFADIADCDMYYNVSKDGELIYISEMSYVGNDYYYAGYADYMRTDDYGDYLEPGEYTIQVYTAGDQWVAEATASVSVSSASDSGGLLEGVYLGYPYTIYDDSFADIVDMYWSDWYGTWKLTDNNTYYSDTQNLCLEIFIDGKGEELYYAFYYLGKSTSDTVDINVSAPMYSGTVKAFTNPDMSKNYEIIYYSDDIEPGDYVLVIADSYESLDDPYITASCTVIDDKST